MAGIPTSLTEEVDRVTMGAGSTGGNTTERAGGRNKPIHTAPAPPPVMTYSSSSLQAPLAAVEGGTTAQEDLKLASQAAAT